MINAKYKNLQEIARVFEGRSSAVSRVRVVNYGIWHPRRSLYRICFVTLSLLMLIVSVGMAVEPEDYKKIIKKEIGYPKDVSYTIPYQLPDSNVDQQKNQEYMKVANVLEKAGLVRLDRK
ncbi:MAG: hypothetical protein HQK96_18360, partial [Nitrospirae bacterium]|nr:hypothetical protein [Nitrospirota bacterium]